MIFLTIPSITGEFFTINPNQIIFIGDFKNGECWIQLPKQSIRITESIYTDLLRHLDRVTLIDDLDGFIIDESETNTIPKDMKCEDLEFTVRTANCLYNADIIFVHQLLELTQTDLLKMKNMGRKSLNEIREKLADKYNAKLKGDQ